MIPSNIIDGLRLQLSILAYDYCNAIDFASGLGTEDAEGSWHLAVDTIFRFYKCGLIKSPDWRTPGKEPSAEQWTSYIRRLLQSNPNDGDADHFAIWMEWDLYPTERTNEIFERFQLGDEGGVDFSGFSAFMERLFTDHNVPWTQVPLITATNISLA